MYIESFNLPCLHACMRAVTSVGSDSVPPQGLQLIRLFCPWDSPGKNSRVGCHAPVQGIFPTQGLNPHPLKSPALAVGFLIPSATQEALSSVQFSHLVVSDSLRPHAARLASLSITNSQNLPKLMSNESVMSSNHLILCCPLLLLPSIFPNIRVFSNELTLRIRWPKYWNFSFNISLSNEHSGLISFRMDWLDLLAVQGVSRVFSNTAVQKHQFFSAQLSSQSNSHIHT